MKKIILFLFMVGMITSLSSCFIFQRKAKYGCPVSVRNTGAENVNVDAKVKKKDRFKGGNIYKY